MHFPLPAIALAFLAGILAGSGFLFFPVATISLAAALFLSGTALVLAGRIALRPALLMIAFCAAGALAAVAATFPGGRGHYRNTLTFDAGEHVVTGRIVSALDRDTGRTSFTLRMKSIDALPSSGRLRVSVRDEEASAGYGDLVRMRGRFLEPRGSRNPGSFDYPAFLARQGIFATLAVRSFEGIEVVRPGRGPLRAIQDMRERIRRHFREATTGQGSAILQAMVLGEEGGLSDGTRDRFMAAGVTHILSISGSHLGLVAFACFGLLRWLFFLLPEPLFLRLTLRADPRKIAAACTVLPVVFYAFLAGGQTATIRSLVMILAVLAAVLLDRENRLLHSLATAALGILIADPLALFEISFQLSFVSVLAIGYTVMTWNELSVPAAGFLQKRARNLLLLLLVSLSAGLVTGPLVAFYFNQVSLIGIVSNVVIVPFAGFAVVPLGLLSGLLSLPLGRLPLPGLNQAAADAFAGTVAFFSRFPLAELHLSSPALPALLAGVAFLAAAAVIVRTRLLARYKPLESSRRTPRPALTVLAVSAAVLAVFAALSWLPRSGARVTFVDVGQGDSALIELPSGKTVLVDGGGTRDNRFDIGRRVVAPYLWDRGITRIDLVVLSHPHPDHMNGLLFVLHSFPVGEVWVHGLDTHLPGYDAFLSILRERKVALRTVSADTPPARIGEAELRVLHPRPNFSSRSRKPYDAENNRSLVVEMELGGKTFIFPGDIGEEAEHAVARTGGGRACDILKVPHHASKTSSSTGFLDRLRPGTAVISVGKGNPYRHPSEEVLERYGRTGSRVLRTDRDGAVIITLRNGELRTTSWANMLLERIPPEEPQLWRAVEAKNWRRILQRTRREI